MLLPDVEEQLPWAAEAFEAAPDAVNVWIGDQRAATTFHKASDMRPQWEGINRAVCAHLQGGRCSSSGGQLTSASVCSAHHHLLTPTPLSPPGRVREFVLHGGRDKGEEADVERVCRGQQHLKF